MVDGPSKTSGQGDQIVGNIKHTVGSVLGNDKMQAEGEAQRTGGQAEVEAAKAKNNAEATGQDIKGHAKDAWGAVTGSDKLQAEGKADKVRADAKHAAN